MRVRHRLSARCTWRSRVHADVSAARAPGQWRRDVGDPWLLAPRHHKPRWQLLGICSRDGTRGGQHSGTTAGNLRITVTDNGFPLVVRKVPITW